MKVHAVFICICLFICSTHSLNFREVTEENNSRRERYVFGKSRPKLYNRYMRSRGSYNEESDDSQPQPLTFISNANFSAVYNEAKHVGYVLNARENMILLVNGKTDFSAVINLESQMGQVFQSNEFPLVWCLDNNDFDEWFSGLTSLKVREANNDMFDENAKNDILYIMKQLVGKFDIAVSDVITFATELGISLKKSLNQIFQVASKDVSVTLKDSVIVLDNTLNAIVSFLDGLIGGFDLLIHAGVELDLEEILSSESGVKVLSSLIKSIVKVLTLDVVEPLLNTPENIVSWIALLGGNVVSGTSDGVFNLLSHIGQVKENKTDINTLINVVLKTSVSANVSINIEQELAVLSDALEASQDSVNDCSVLDPLFDFINDVKNQSLKLYGVAVSTIIKSLSGVVNDVVLFTVTVLASINNIISTITSIPMFMLHLIGFLTTEVGKFIITKVIPTLDLTAEGNIIQIVANAINPFTLFNLFTKGIGAVLDTIPIVGTIYKALANSVLDVIQMPVQDLIKLNIGVLNAIKAWLVFVFPPLKFVLGIQGNVNEARDAANSGLVESYTGVIIVNYRMRKSLAISVQQ